MAQGARKTIYLIDAHNLIYQVFHAIRDGISAPDGRPSNAVFGFARDMIYLSGDVKPDYLVCLFDAGSTGFRNEVYPEYKAHRPPPPSDLTPQFPMIEQVLAAMNIPALSKPGFEADDLMATLAAAAEKRDFDVLLCTSDKDCRQLITDRVKLLNLRKRTVMGRNALLEDWGVGPEQVVDYQAMVGDSVDNVPGVEGVGAKTAAKLLQEFGSLEGIRASIADVKPPRARKNIQAAFDSGSVEVSRQLVRLVDDVDVPMDWDAWKLQGWDRQPLLELFQEFGFRTLADRVRDTLKAAGAKKNVDLLALAGAGPGAGPGDDTDFNFGALADAPEDEPAWEADYALIDTDEAFAAFLEKLLAVPRFAFDLETDALDPIHGRVVGYAFCWEAGKAYYLPVAAPDGEPKLDPERTLQALKPVFEDGAVAKVNQNIKFDDLALRRHGVRLAGVAGDPMLADYLLHAGEKTHGLDEMTRRYFRHENTPIEELIGKGKKATTMDKVAPAKVCAYAGEDADAAWRLAGRLEADLESEGLRGLYDELEVPLIDVLATLEEHGVRIDSDFLRALSVEMEQELRMIEADIHKAAGRPFNTASPKQLREVLFEELKLPPQKRTSRTGEASTDQETLERLAALGHELPKKIIEYRQVQKLKGTYVDTLPELVSPDTGRVHASFNQTVTSTGRLSASGPNLQNIPTRTDAGRRIRKAFVPRDGWRLLTADYSQVELRMMAHYCGDDELRNAFAEDRDIHAAVAGEIFQVPPASVTKDQRRVAKMVNFGVIYGISAHGLATRLGTPRDQAAKFIDAYFGRYPKVLEYQDAVLAKCRKTGYCTTLLGRRRRFDKSAVRAKSTYQSRNQAEREAINMEIQGSAADLIKRAMLAAHRRLRDEGWQSRMILSVHDELVFEVPPAELEGVAELARGEMAAAMELAVPLKVDLAAGPNWLEVTPLGAA